MWNEMMQGHGMGAFQGLMGFHGLFWLVLLVVITITVIALRRDRNAESDPETRVRRSRLDRLASRYADGEIGREEYLKARKDLEG